MESELDWWRAVRYIVHISRIEARGVDQVGGTSSSA